MSTKTRKNTKACFGFARYNSFQEAEEAILQLHDFVVRGRKLWVSMAKYEKDRAPVANFRSKFQKQQGRNPQTNFREQGRKTVAKFTKSRNLAYRDGRRYSEVVAGVQKQLEKMKEELMEKVKVIPVTHSINVTENVQIARMLQLAIIAENTEVLDIPHI